MYREYNLSMRRMRDRTRKVLQVLGDAFGPLTWPNPLPPVEELISTILSQNTNDANRDRAFRGLRERFPAWEDLLVAPTVVIEDAIRPAGLGPQKAPRIREVLRRIFAERGRLELDFLRRMPPSEARAWLRRLPGVGPKTAAIVLLFSLGMPAFPVDTHIFRVSGRLGLRPEKMTLEAAHELLADLIAPEEYARAHLLLIRLGREICHARKPDCPRCPLQSLCPYPRRRK
jgi:endonuclease III